MSDRNLFRRSNPRSANSSIVSSFSVWFWLFFRPLSLGLAGGGKTELAVADKTTSAGLGQNAVQQTQWERLGFTPDTAASLITARFDYSFNLVELIITALVVVGSFIVLFRFSEGEYHDVSK